MHPLLVSSERFQSFKEESRNWKSWTLTPRQLCDLELLLNGGFSPLHQFLGRLDYDAVCQNMRLTNGTLWPIPIILDLPFSVAQNLNPHEKIILQNNEGLCLAILTLSELWEPDRRQEAQHIYGTSNPEHSGVYSLLHQTHPVYVSGNLEGLSLPPHYDFQSYRHTPSALKKEFQKQGWADIVAFQTRNPLHRAHVEMTLRAMQEYRAKLLIHPSVGLTQSGDVDYFTRVRCYQAVLPYYPNDSVKLSLLPLAMRMAGPREALLHAIVRKNYGCTHFIVGRNHASPAKDSKGNEFYAPYEAQELLQRHEKEIQIRPVLFREMLYLEESNRYLSETEILPHQKPRTISGTKFRELLAQGAEIPSWFSYPEVIHELRKIYPKKTQQGLTLFFTGLPSSGKSTLANSVMHKFLEIGDRAVSLLDGDVVRKMLSSELSFSKEHRELHLRRVGYVASEITKNRGVAICAMIAPYEQTRKEIRERIQTFGNFVLIYLSTPLSVCEQRDRKGLYTKARQRIIKDFTGISDPYEVPTYSELTLDTSQFTIEEATTQIWNYLKQEQYVS